MPSYDIRLINTEILPCSLRAILLSSLIECLRALIYYTHQTAIVLRRPTQCVFLFSTQH